ncbi:hypothetical protein EIP91_002807 [Steccherinum ochraceum]|uniref:DUF6533 domain-containing protein n=1 Tax=Steccherinum ochraceum TaxID=92696 RepID=A0A4R0RBI3_9APHY|nr:hypothetical protein EIP91_002807 [Steccherinum ochraceum]
MSSLGEPSVFFLNACVLVTAVVAGHDTLLTLSREIEFIWTQRFKLRTVLFLLQRYAILVNALLYVVQVDRPTVLSCESIAIASYAVSAAGLLSVACFSVLRVWVISSQRWLPTASVFLVSMVVPAMNIYTYCQPQRFYLNDGKCAVEFTEMAIPGTARVCSILIQAYGTMSEFGERDRTFSFVVRCSAIASDLLVLIITWTKTTDVWKFRSSGFKLPIKTLFFRSGSEYFLVLLLLNVITLVLDVTVPDVVGVTPFVYIHDAIAANLIARFILDLQSVLNPEDTTTMATASSGSLLDNILPPDDVSSTRSSKIENIPEPLRPMDRE